MTGLFGHATRAVLALVLVFAGVTAIGAQRVVAGTGFNGGDISVTPSTGLDPMGDLAHVHLSGFTPNDIVEIRECVAPPTSASDECDTLIGTIFTDQFVLANGTWDRDIAVYDCDTAHDSCYIAAFEATLQVAAYQQVFFGNSPPPPPTCPKYVVHVAEFEAM